MKGEGGERVDLGLGCGRRVEGRLLRRVMLQLLMLLLQLQLAVGVKQHLRVGRHLSRVLLVRVMLSIVATAAGCLWMKRRMLPRE